MSAQSSSSASGSTEPAPRIEQRTKHIAKGERQKRAHRLITRGAAVESVAPTVRNMSEHEFYELVERIFALPDVQTLLPKGGE